MLKFRCPISTRFEIETYQKSWEYMHYECTFYFKRCMANIPDWNPTNILDIGACMGSLAMFANSNFRNARVIAVEADDINFKFMQDNVADNNLPVECLEGAVTKESDTERILYKIDSNFGQNSLHYRTDKNLYPLKVKTIGFNDLINKFNGNVSFCKIDIEGAEYEFIDKDAIDSLMKIEILDIDIHPITENYFSNDKETEYKSNENAYYDMQAFLESIGFRKIYKDDHRLWWNANLGDLKWKCLDVEFTSIDDMIFYRKLRGEI